RSVERSTEILAHSPPFQAASPWVTSPSSSVVPSPRTWMVLPIEPENDESTKICRGGSQCAPPPLVRGENVCELNGRARKKPLSDACVLPPGLITRSQAA